MDELINLYDNDMFSSFRGIDLQDLIIYIQAFDLRYRDTLWLPRGVTFGPEIEFENLSNDVVNNYLITLSDSFFSEFDGSLSNGGEFNSFLMRDDVSHWIILKKICMFLKDKKADMSHNAGGHIHVGAHILGSDCDAWLDFLKLYTAYESVLFRFFYGDKVSARKKILRFAPPIADDLYSILDSIKDAKSIQDIFLNLPMDKYQALSFWHVNFADPDEMKKGHTVEFRMPNGSAEEVVLQNYINVCTKMLLYASMHCLDTDFLNYKLDKERISSSRDFCLYHEVLLKNSLEFVDILFNNNLDKIYFLKQYLKNFKSDYNSSRCLKKGRNTF